MALSAVPARGHHLHLAPPRPRPAAGTRHRTEVVSAEVAVLTAKV